MNATCCLFSPKSSVCELYHPIKRKYHAPTHIQTYRNWFLCLDGLVSFFFFLCFVRMQLSWATLCFVCLLQSWMFYSFSLDVFYGFYFYILFHFFKLLKSYINIFIIIETSEKNNTNFWATIHLQDMHVN
jgi:signal transduction histidine kinase